MLFSESVDSCSFLSIPKSSYPDCYNFPSGLTLNLYMQSRIPTCLGTKRQDEPSYIAEVSITTQ